MRVAQHLFIPSVDISVTVKVGVSNVTFLITSEQLVASLQRNIFAEQTL